MFWVLLKINHLIFRKINVYLRENIMTMFKYNPTGRISLFDKDENSEKLSKLGNPLEKLFAHFHQHLDDILNF